MTSPTRWFRSVLIAVAVLGALMPAIANAATRLFVVANEHGAIWEVDPATGNKIGETVLVPPTHSVHAGLAYDGTYLYYTDETLDVIQVYVPGGAIDRTLPKPAPVESGSGLGATKTSLFAVSLDDIITEITSTTGTELNSFNLPGARQGLTYAGSRGSLFVVINDSTTIREISPAGAVLNTIVAAEIFRGLAFSSSTGTLYGVRAGFLTALNPATGATLAGYPVQIHDDANNVVLTKSAAAAADEPVLEECGDQVVNAPGETCDPPGSTQTNGQPCRSDCTYCGDTVIDTGEQCDDGNSIDTDACRNKCTLPTCGDGIVDQGEACDDGNLVDGDGCDSDCQIEGVCGDGIVQEALGEKCEPPNTATCDATCQPLEICLDLEDNDGDGAIDCLDPDCDCLPIGRDPGAIRFGRPGSGDLFAVHGSLDPGISNLDPTTDQISFLLTNANGKVYELVIPADTAKKIGANVFRFRDRTAVRKRSGLARFDLRYYPRRDNYTFVVKVYGDLTKATVADMAVQLAIGDDGFLNQSTWKPLPKGWKLTLPGE